PRHPTRDPVGEEVHRRAVDEEREAHDRLPAATDALARPGPLKPSAHRLVLDAVFGQERAVALDALPDALDPLGIASLEVVDRVHDGPREPDQVDLPLREPALFPKLAHELAAVQLLDGGHEPALVDPLDVDDFGLHRPLDRVGEGLDRLDGIRPAGAT